VSNEALNHEQFTIQLIANKQTTETMKTKFRLLQWILVLVLTAGWTGVMGQSSTTPTQTICPGVQPYLVHPGSISNTYQWRIDGAFPAGPGWVIANPTDSMTNVTWTNNGSTPLTFTMTFTEHDPVTGCDSTRSLTVTVLPTPLPPTSGGDITQCEQSPIQTITATATAPSGSTVVWYDAPTGGNIVPSPTLSAVGTVTYYAESQTTGSPSCSSLTRTAVTLTILPAPAPPTSGGDITQCEQSPIQTITATATAPSGSTVVWYDAPTGGNIVASPTLSAVGTVTYYAESQTTGSPSCSSLTRTAVTLTILPAPAPPTSGGDITQCEQSPIQTITATATAPSGSTVVWYDAPTGGNIVASPILSAVGTVTYYAESQTIGSPSCSSLTRTPVTLTINPRPLTSPIWHN